MVDKELSEYNYECINCGSTDIIDSCNLIDIRGFHVSMECVSCGVRYPSSVSHDKREAFYDALLYFDNLVHAFKDKKVDLAKLNTKNKYLFLNYIEETTKEDENDNTKRNQRQTERA